MVPATCVPWSPQSVLLLSMVLVPQVARPVKSGWVMSMPVSITYACTPAPVLVYVYDFDSRLVRWSTRSMPQDGGFGWVVSRTPSMRAFSEIATTSGLRCRDRSWAGVRVAANPLTAAV
jgi:hypothetical protein